MAEPRGGQSVGEVGSPRVGKNWVHRWVGLGREDLEVPTRTHGARQALKTLGWLPEEPLEVFELPSDMTRMVF